MVRFDFSMLRARTGWTKFGYSRSKPELKCFVQVDEKLDLCGSLVEFYKSSALIHYAGAKRLSCKFRVAALTKFKFNTLLKFRGPVSLSDCTAVRIRLAISGRKTLALLSVHFVYQTSSNQKNTHRTTHANNEHPSEMLVLNSTSTGGKK